MDRMSGGIGQFNLNWPTFGLCVLEPVRLKPVVQLPFVKGA